MAPTVRFSVRAPRADRVHHVSPDDVRVVLSRLPLEVWKRLRTVHFNDRSWGARTFGYVNRGRHDIALCALPPRMSLGGSVIPPQTPEYFGAARGTKWPVLAIR